MDILVGLGNPGPEYKNTRHNIGFRIIEQLTHELGVNLESKRFQSKTARLKIEGKDIIFLCPMTYMNLSGQAVRLCTDYYKVGLENVVAIHDDLDLPIGRIKIARQGGAGGHKGVQSIINHLGGSNFPRIRVGIGRPRYEENIETFVLSPFYKDQTDVVDEMVKIGVEACRLIIADGVGPAMNRINRQVQKDKESRDSD